MSGYLPPELWHHICSILAPQDVKSLRLVNRSLASIGLEHLIDEVNVIFSRASMERLASISGHPFLRRCVRSIRISVQILPKLDRQEWVNRGAYSFATAKELMDSCWTQYADFAASQVELLESGDFILSIQESLSHLLRLDGLTIQLDGFENACHPMDCPLFTSQCKKTDVQYFNSMPESLARLSRDILPAVLLCLGRVDKPISTLNVDCFHWKLFSATPDNSTTILNALCSLTTIDIACPVVVDLADDIDDPDPGKFNMDMIRRFLGAAPNLEEIAVCFCECDTEIPRALQYAENFLSDHTWPLRTLQVVGMVVSSRHMLYVVKRHKQTLRHLALINIFFCSHSDLHPFTDFSKQVKDLTQLEWYEMGEFQDRYSGEIEMRAKLENFPKMTIQNAMQYLVCGNKDAYSQLAEDAPEWDEISWTDLEELGL